MKTSFIISEYRKDFRITMYVCARPGYCRTAEGKMRRDGSLKGGPEWTRIPSQMLRFASHRAAAVVRNKCGDTAKITEINY